MMNDEIDLIHFQKIIKYLEKHKIKYSLMYDKKGMFVFEHPKDLRIFYTDVEVTKDFKTIHTNKFKYRLVWTIWNDRRMQRKTVFNQDDAIKLIKDIIKDFGTSNYVQETLELF